MTAKCIIIVAVSVAAGRLNNRQRKEMRDVAKMRKDENSRDFLVSAYLIAQLARNFAVSEKWRVTGRDLFGAIFSHIGVLLVDRPELAAVLQKKVSAELNAGRKEGLSEKEIARKMIDSLMACHLGTAINSCLRESMKLAYNIDRVVAANAKAAAARAKLAIAKANRAMAASR